MVQYARSARVEAIEAELVARLGVAAPGRIGLDRDRLQWLLPTLVQLVETADQQPAGRLAEAVRTQVLDLLFAGACGDPALPAHHEAAVQNVVDVLTETVERLRAEETDDEAWHLRRPMTPMYG